MRSVSLAIAVAVASIVPFAPLLAQQAPPAAAQQAPPAPETVVLPQVDVETEAAPAKRNKKKQAIKKNISPAAAGPAVADQVALPGIAVEGEKVVRTLQDTTTSIGVVTGQQIREEQIQDLQEALNTQANVIAPEGSRGNAGFSIRGVSSEGLTQNQSAGASPAISVVIDGATQNAEATRRGARGLWDVEQVEVLRGPQSTLQARNSIGGAVFIKTKDPTYKWQTIVEGTGAQDSLRSGAFMVNAPIVTNQMALRISGQAFERNHDIEYVDPNDAELDEDRLRTFRSKLLIEPDSMEGLSALFTISRTYDKPGVTAVSGPDFFARVFDSAADPFTLVDYRVNTTTNYISDMVLAMYLLPLLWGAAMAWAISASNLRPVVVTGAGATLAGAAIIVPRLLGAA